jgi:hypothetical protein
MESRRNFVAKIAAGMAATGIISIPRYSEASDAPIKDVFVHHVFFWLKEPSNSEARKQFEQGLNNLIAIPQIQSSHIGTPVESASEVVDDSFSYSFLTFFKSKEDQDNYETHPIHLKFIEECKHIWKKVIVYDAKD